ncbi:MAG: aminoglycoside phosphotransferase family protein [Dehalococcoidia bacterium]
MIELTAKNVFEYLVDNGHLFPAGADRNAEVTVLEGGISNLTVLVKTSRQSLVVKQSLGKLNVKGEWLADRARILREAAAIGAYSKVLSNGEIPGLLFVDEDNFIIGIEEVERPATVWQVAIDSGIVMPDHARIAGQTLARMHSAVPNQVDLELLNDLSHLNELRINPYFVHAAIANPMWADKLETATESLLSHQTDLVHGDFAPKNLFIRNTDPQITVLDFEVAHMGNPAFDLAFFISHLVIDAHYAPSLRSDFLSAARTFWGGYQSQKRIPTTARLEQDTALLLPCLLLARVDGLSRVEYLSESDRDSVRATAYGLLEADTGCIHRSIEDSIGSRQLIAS